MELKYKSAKIRLHAHHDVPERILSWKVLASAHAHWYVLSAGVEGMLPCASSASSRPVCCAWPTTAHVNRKREKLVLRTDLSSQDPVVTKV